MSQKMLVTMRMDQRLQMSQQLRQAITLLQYTTLDLKQLVQQYIDTNPMIEMEETEESGEVATADENENSTDPYMNSYSADWKHKGKRFVEDSTLENICKPKHLRDHLLDQTLLCQFNEVEQMVAETIIDAIDDQGFLTTSINEIYNLISENNSVEFSLAQHVLSTIQTFDPIGVASHDMHECLLIQLKSLYEQGNDYKLAYRIIQDFYREFCEYEIKIIIKNLNVTQAEFKAANEIILGLNLYPGTQYSHDTNIYVEPELYVKKIKKKWQVMLADSILTEIKINQHYQHIVRQSKKHASYQSLKQELEEAKALLTGLKRRNQTLLSVASYIMSRQQDFLEKGLTYMKPMNIIDVSTALDLHESTVSRITTGKFIATPRGVLELKYFFPSQVSSSTGSTHSNISVKEYIKEIIQHEAEDNPYSDADLVDLLKARGIQVARRTVAKYREAMKILPSYQRVRIKVAKSSRLIGENK